MNSWATPKRLNEPAYPAGLPHPACRGLPGFLRHPRSVSEVSAASCTGSLFGHTIRSNRCRHSIHLPGSRGMAARSALVMNMLDLGRKILASQPFSVLLGAELLALSPGAAEIKVPIRPQLEQQHGFVHGGVVSYLRRTMRSPSPARQRARNCRGDFRVQDQLRQARPGRPPGCTRERDPSRETAGRLPM